MVQSGYDWAIARRYLTSGILIERRTWLLLILFGAELATIYFARTGRSFWPVVVPWLLSLGAAVLLFRGRTEPGSRRWPNLLTIEVLVVAGLTLLAAVLRLPGLEHMPGGIYGDEGEFAVRALEVTEGGGPAPFGIAFFGDPALYIYMLAPFVEALGPTMEAVRLPSALIGTATVPLLYGLTRDLYGRNVAVFAALLLATSAVHIHFSRLAINVVWVPFFACLSLWLLQRGLGPEGARRDDLYLLLAGIAGGLGIYSHFSARLIALILALILLGQFISAPRQWRVWLRSIALAGLGGLLALAPLLAYLSNDPLQLIEHSERRGIWKHWEELAERYDTVPSDKAGILVEQVRRTLGAFVTRPDPMDGAQMYSFMDAALLHRSLGLLALFGLALLWFRVRRLDARMVLIWFMVPIIFASVLTDVAGQSHRLIHPLLPALVGAALIIEWFRRHALSRLPQSVEFAGVGLLVIVALLPGARDTYRYFQPEVTDAFGPKGTAQARCLEALPDDTLALVLGAPQIYARHGPSRYLGHDVERRDIDNPATDLPVDSRGRPVVILVHERNLDELPEIMQVYPDARMVEVERPPGEPVMFVVTPSTREGPIPSLLTDCELNAST